MFDFLNLENNVVGLDASGTVLRLSKIEKKEKLLTLVTLKERVVEDKILCKGKIENENFFSLTLKNLFEEAAEKEKNIKYVTLSISEERSFLKIIKVPKMEKEDLMKAVLYEAENHLPFSMNEIYFDFEIISPLNRKFIDVLIIAVPKNILDPYLRAMEKIDVAPIAIETSPFSIKRALMGKEKKSSSLLIVNIGKIKATFLLFSENFLCFTTTFYFSPEEKDISIDLIEKINNCLEYYNRNLRHQVSKKEEIKKVIFCGDTNIEKDLIEKVSKEIGIHITEGNPSVQIDNDLTSSKQEKSSYTTAIGAGLRHHFLN